MVRPCVASGFAELAVSGLASMYPAIDWSVCSWPSCSSARDWLQRYNLETIVSDFLTGQFNDPVRVVACHPEGRVLVGYIEGQSSLPKMADVHLQMASR